MKDYIKIGTFFAVLALIAYIGSQNLSMALWLLGGVFIGFSFSLGMARQGFFYMKGDGHNENI